ncbi:MAG TPA: PAC2 family protein [Verrucomicrobiae bacterium]|nr:PAC2 family protein [Verrucomicrobiae bacterium]
MALYRLTEPKDLVAPTMIAAFDGWVDAGAAATTAAAQLAEGGDLVATFEGDLLFDYRARRPTLEIRDGRMASLTWRELTIRRARIGERDLLVLTGVEPDFRWREFSDAVLDIASRLGVAQWISLGAIPAAVPHTRAVPIMGTESEAGLLRGNVRPGPEGLLRVPAAALSVLEMMMARSGTTAVGYFAQVPHYVSGPYPVAALALLRTLERHIGVSIPAGTLEDDARQLGTHLDSLAKGDETTRAYVERLESMVDEERLPAGDELISEIERFLRETGSGGSQRP